MGVAQYLIDKSVCVGPVCWRSAKSLILFVSGRVAFYQRVASSSGCISVGESILSLFPGPPLLAVPSTRTPGEPYGVVGIDTVRKGS